MKHALQHVHLVGVGGSGMSGIAEILLGMGLQVSGSDLHDSTVLQRLGRLGVHVHVGHAASHVGDADAVVVSSAVGADNPEVVQARSRNLPVVARGVMLAELMRQRLGIAVAGAHGKTTTTALITSVLQSAGMAPGYVVGGVLHSSGTSAQVGQGDFMVVESDESDASFLHLRPVVAVVTNIDGDHMETYGHDPARLDQAFVDFVHGLPFYGHAVVCLDDPGVQRIQPRLQRPLVTYGLGEQAMLRAVNVRAEGTQMHFDLLRNDGAQPTPPVPVVLNLSGVHNVLNALAALAVARVVGADQVAGMQALARFQGVGRRQESHGEQPLARGGHFALIEDYGHHPVEIEATLAAMRAAYPGRRLVLAFEPHRYTRTRDCFAEFVRVLGLADVLLLTDVYSAGEPAIPGAHGEDLLTAVRANRGAIVQWVGAVQGLPQELLAQARDGDVVLCMGAGTIGEVAGQLARLARSSVGQEVVQ